MSNEFPAFANTRSVNYNPYMTTEQRKILAQQPIVWTGDLNDDCTALWNGLMLRAECMDKGFWWWAVYDMQDGEAARHKAEGVARKYIDSKL